ncbi:nuclear transport factor 2 family protein [Candidatus Frankia nodulisporulans]|uniref:nuclear transport factor 2 family protein n=1 Tax=Candidatus Frankia nodulisporulans TaxID=2060052 RepID=UPI0013D42729|nr:nuclear transport factor 2 family protein [Candidatus Frankia nodulisporulans]
MTSPTTGAMTGLGFSAATGPASVQTRVDGLADRLYTAWAQPDPDTRTRLLAGCCADQVSYANPLGAAVGVDALSALIGEFLGPYPGHRPVRVSAVDVHHDRARWEWGLRDSIGQVVLAGLDVATFDQHGLTTISTFFGPPPPLTRTYTYTHGQGGQGGPRG